MWQRLWQLGGKLLLSVLSRITWRRSGETFPPTLEPLPSKATAPTAAGRKSQHAGIAGCAATTAAKVQGNVLADCCCRTAASLAATSIFLPGCQTPWHGGESFKSRGNHCRQVRDQALGGNL